MSSGSPVTGSTDAGSASRKPRSGIAVAAATRSIGPEGRLHTGADLLAEKQRSRLHWVSEVDEHVEVQATWGTIKRIDAAYREPNKTRGKQLMQAVRLRQQQCSYYAPRGPPG